VADCVEKNAENQKQWDSDHEKWNSCKDDNTRLRQERDKARKENEGLIEENNVVLDLEMRLQTFEEDADNNAQRLKDANGNNRRMAKEREDVIEKNRELQIEIDRLKREGRKDAKAEPDGADEVIPNEEVEKPSEEDIIPKGQECCVCLSKRRTHVMIPCGHRAICEECAPAINTCPICRAAVTTKVKVFLRRRR
jgi:hypothetical protein